MSNFWELFFHVFMRKNFIFNFFLHCSVRTKKLLKIQVKKIFKKLGSIFFGLKTGLFRASCFGHRVKGVCPLLIPLVSLRTSKIYLYI